MARWIDQIALWALSAFCAFFLMMVVTDGRLLPSASAAFIIVLTIRFLSGRLSKKRWVGRRKLRASAERMIRKWALLPEKEGFEAAVSCLPDEDRQGCIHFVQLLPDGGRRFTANELMELWRRHRGRNMLLIVVTCEAEAEAFAMLAELSLPSVRLYDSRKLTDVLLRMPEALPEEPMIERRRRNIIPCAVRWIGTIRPLRAAVYSALFLLMYLATRSVLYLTASLVQGLLLIARLVYRIREKVHPVC